MATIRWIGSLVVGHVLILAGSAYLHAQGAPEGRTVRIVTLGDSITKGVRPGVKREDTFAYLLEQVLNKEGIKAEVINIGIGGENSAQALARLDKAVLALKPEIVTIMYGTNDSWVDKGKSEPRLTKDEFRANLGKLVMQMRKAGITPILMTEPRFGDKHDPNGAGQNPNKVLEEYIKICREVAADLKTPLVDHFAHWSKANAGGTDVGTWTTDQCHPNRKGMEEMTQIILPVVRKVFSKKDRQSKE